MPEHVYEMKELKERVWETVEITGLELMNGKIYRANSQNNEDDGYCKYITPFKEPGQMAFVIWFNVENDWSDDIIVPGHAVSRIFYANTLEGK